MITYLFKTSIRYLTQNKLFTSINLVCIVIGLTCSTLLFLYVKNEFNADKFFPSYESIYHVDTNWGNSLALTHGEVLKKNLPEIEAITLYQSSWSDQTIVKYNKNDYNIENAIYVDSGFFNVFEYSVYQGNLIDAMMQPYSIILTKKQALKIFGNTNPIDQIAELKTSRFGISKYTVKAVLEDLPNNCSFHFDMVLPLSDLMNIEWYKANAEHWGTCNYSAFVKLAKGTNPKILEQKAGLAFLSDAPEWVHDIVPIKFNSLNDLHFGTDAGDDVFTANNKFIVILLGAIGSLILLIAGINYLNLNMSKTDENVKEWNIKRTIGATKTQLMMQSLLSSIIIILIGTTLSGFLIVSLLPAFNLYTQSSFQIANIVTPENTYLLGGIMLFALLLFGIIPALISSNQPIINVIKTTKSSTLHTKKYNLVVFQFCISTLLIIGSLVIYKQNNLLMNHNSGYKTNNILYIQLNQEAREKSEFLETEFEKIANVDKVAFSNGIFGTNGSNWGRLLYYEGNEIDVEFAVYSASYDFFDLFELNVTDGNGFDKNSIINRDLIVNEAFIKKSLLTD
jgi:putative ABC transport system permease protein